MDEDREAKIRERAYQLWQEQGEPHGRHEDHWAQAEKDVGMMGDGTEEQNLGQPGHPEARVSKADVEAAFAPGAKAQ